MPKFLKILSLCCATFLASQTSIANEQSLKHGAKDFAEHCSACHGNDARGFGPKAGELKVRPADLTRLSLNNGGNFPTKKITDLVDGRPDKGLSRAHSNGDMPSWGDVFRNEKGHSLSTTVTAEKQTTIRINNLVQYIHSLQK